MIKPGVIDNTAARPASPYEGQVIFQKDTDQLLVWNGTVWVIPNSPAQNPTGLELISTSTVTSGTTLTIPNVFNTTYDNYRIIISDFSTTGSAAGLSMTLGDPNEVTAGYFWAGVYLSGYAASPTFTAAGAAAGSFLDLNLVAQGSQSAGGAIDLFNPFKAVTTNYTCIGVDARSSSANPRQPATGFHNGSNQFTMVKFTCGTTIANINVSIYGYRK